MSDHFPECDENWMQDKRAEHPYCICPALRAYEKRVRDELFPQRWNRAEELEKARINGWHAGWNAAQEDAYNKGYKDAEKYYTNSCFLCGYAGEWSTWICDECQDRMNQEAKEWEDE